MIPPFDPSALSDDLKARLAHTPDRYTALTPKVHGDRVSLLSCLDAHGQPVSVRVSLTDTSPDFPSDGPTAIYDQLSGHLVFCQGIEATVEVSWAQEGQPKNMAIYPEAFRQHHRRQRAQATRRRATSERIAHE